MLSNSLPDGDLNRQEMKTKSPTCPSGGYHMYENYRGGSSQGALGARAPPLVSEYIFIVLNARSTQNV